MPSARLPWDLEILLWGVACCRVIVLACVFLWFFFLNISWVVTVTLNISVAAVNTRNTKTIVKWLFSI
jgi:hypothetical protein